jgi:hypothetical protein
VDEDLDSLMESLDAQDRDMYRHGEGCVLENLERLDGDGYLSEGEEGWCALLSNGKKDKEGSRGGDNKNDGEADGCGYGGQEGDVYDVYNLLKTLV